MNDQATRKVPDLQRRGAARATDATSPSLNLGVSKPGNEDARLPRPAIADADGDRLDLGAFDGDATITCAPWTFIAAGQKVWLAVDGTLADGSATTLTLWTASNVVASEVVNGLSEALPRSWLESLLNESSIAVRLKVSFDGSSDRAHSVAFPARLVTVRVSEFNLVDDFDKYALGPVTHQRPLDFLIWNRSDSSYWSIVTAPNGLNGRCLRLLTNSPPSGPYSYLGFLTADGRLPVSIIEFTYVAMSGANSMIPFYIQNGPIKEVHWLVVDRQPHVFRAEIASTDQYDFGFGGTPTGPGTLDIYVDNLKIKTP
jgi:hypothetical protein